MLRKHEVQDQHPSTTPIFSWQIIEHLKREHPELFTLTSTSHNSFLSLTDSQLQNIERHSVHAQEIQTFFSPSGLFEQIINDLTAYGQVNASLFMTHKRIGAFECIAQRMIPHNGYRTVNVTYWPQIEKGFLSGNYKKVKTNCYQIDMRVHDNGTIENIKSQHFVALSKNSPLFLSLPQNRALEREFPNLSDRTQHVCSKEDGWSQKHKLSKKNISKQVFIAQWLGEPLLNHIQLARQFVGRLMEHIILGADEIIASKQFPYDLKGGNVVVSRSKDGLAFHQIDYATFAVTPARFPRSEANLDQIKYQINFIAWISSVRDKMDRDPWCVFTSNFIFLIFELYDWNHYETSRVLVHLLAHIISVQPTYIDGRAGIWPEDFCRHFGKKAQSFIQDAREIQTEWRKAVRPQTAAIVSNSQQAQPATIPMQPPTMQQHKPHVPAIPSFLTKSPENKEYLSIPQSTMVPFASALGDSTVIIVDDTESTIPPPKGYFEQATAFVPTIKRMFGFL